MKLCAAIISLLFVLGTSAIGSEDFGGFLFHHIGNSEQWVVFPGIWIIPRIVVPLPAHIEIMGINMGISLHVLMLFFAAVTMTVLLIYASRREKGVPMSLFGHAIEAIVVYLRDEVIVPSLGKKDAARWLSFFLTLFFFILTLNLLGMIPILAATTANINCTAALAVMTFVAFNVAGMAKNGPIGYVANLVPKGIPWPIVIILMPIELVGLLTKAFALAIRLFANMTAGHVVIFALLGLISIFKDLYFISVPASILFALFISLIEILVAFLQAYVFTLLASLFIGMAIHQEH